MLSPDHREIIANELPRLSKTFPKLLMNTGMARAFVNPPSSPSDCLFSKMSVNLSADLETRVEPCVFGGTPDCSQCGCAASSGLHWIRTEKVVGPLTVGHFVESSVAMGWFVNRLKRHAVHPSRWRPRRSPGRKQIRVGSDRLLIAVRSSGDSITARVCGAAMKRAFFLIPAVLLVAAIPQAKAQSSAPAGGASAAPLRVAMAGLSHGHADGFLTRVKDRQDVQIVAIAEPDRKLFDRYAAKFNLDGVLRFDRRNQNNRQPSP